MSKVTELAMIIREEMLRQAESIYFWDRADVELLDGGTPEPAFVGAPNGPKDRFDFELLAQIILDKAGLS